MPTLIASGTQTAVIGTEHDLDIDTTSNTFVLSVDIGAMALADVVELRIYTKVLAGGTERAAYTAVYAHAQTAAIVFSVPVLSVNSIRCTLKQTAGTGRAYPWSLLAL